MSNRKASKSRKALQVALIEAAWRNDQADGLGIECEGVVASQLMEAIELSMPLLDLNADPDKLRAQLAVFAGNKEHLPDTICRVAIISIAWLESRGHLQSDQYNGVRIYAAKVHYEQEMAAIEAERS